jgi:hypothetical protein
MYSAGGEGGEKGQKHLRFSNVITQVKFMDAEQ